jgi:hypothetical protein
MLSRKHAAMLNYKTPYGAARVPTLILEEADYVMRLAQMKTMEIRTTYLREQAQSCFYGGDQATFIALL